MATHDDKEAMNPGSNPPPSGIAHEERDIDVKAVLRFAGGILIIAVIVHVVIFFVFETLRHRETRESPHLSPLTPRAVQLPIAPRLQVHGPKELSEMRAQEDQILDTYGWTDRDQGWVRVPIREAMKLHLQDARDTGGVP